MKYFLFLLGLLFPFLAIAQKRYENSYLTMDIPEGWEVQNMDIPGVSMEMLYFYNSGDNPYNIGLILGIEQYQEPRYILENQIALKNNVLFEEAVFENIRPSTFMGKPASTVDFSTRLNGQAFKGAAYAFNEGDCSLLVVGSYKVGVKSNLPQIWRSIHWKKHVKKQKNMSLREELEMYVATMNDMFKANKPIANGEEMVSVELESGEDCVVYTSRLTEFSKNEFTDEQIEYMHRLLREKLVPLVKGLAKQTELIQRCMDSEYVFKYVYLDKDGEFLLSVKITPDDYK